LTYAYPNGTVALREISLSIPAGKKTVVLGSNGSGKSTLFLHFNGVLKPKQGEVYYSGRKVDYGKRSLVELREQVAVVLQNPDDQIFSTTVEEDVAFGPLNLNLSKEEVERRVDEALFLVDLEDVRGRPTQQLSFGQRKRIALAGALAMKPKVLMMDEPTAGLDSRMVHELLELADELNQKGLTVIMSTHDVETAYEWADEVQILHQGRLQFSGLPEDFFLDERKVHSLGLVRPTLYDMNLRLKGRVPVAGGATPRDLEEMLQKLAPSKVVVGGITLVEVDGSEPKARAAAEALRNWRSGRSGVYGTRARRLAHDSSLPVDYHFNALENCVRAASEGVDSLLLVDVDLKQLVRRRLQHLDEGFGLRIPLHEA